MDLITLGLGVVTIAGTPIGYSVKKFNKLSSDVATLTTAYTAHAAADAVVFKSVEQALADLKTGQRDQTEKLDRLIERFL